MRRPILVLVSHPLVLQLLRQPLAIIIVDRQWSFPLHEPLIIWFGCDEKPIEETNQLDRCERAEPRLQASFIIRSHTCGKCDSFMLLGTEIGNIPKWRQTSASLSWAIDRSIVVCPDRKLLVLPLLPHSHHHHHAAEYC
jgi:hypothetical protein